MGVVLFNNSEADFAVKPGDRVIQMIVQVIAMPEVAEVEDLDITVWRSSRWRTSTPPSRGCRGGGPRRHRHEVAKVKDLDSLVDISREVVMLGWWWNVREGTYLSVTVVCV
uniref:dUTP diphosphatase n=1 Tax=Triticum urartu TaxID=4572 RepID=A0A8R7U165_TRIUA